MIFSFRRKQKIIIREALDNLPDGLCYFNMSGKPVLCNYTMHRLVFALSGHDLQHSSQLISALKNPAKETGIELKDGIYYLPDETAWRFTFSNVTDEEGNIYQEYIASNVTQLCLTKSQLEKDNACLKEMTKQLKRLSANISVVTREEETLSLKMCVHDQMGRSLVAAHKILKENEPMENVYPILKEWRHAIELLKKAGNEPERKDVLSELKRISEGMIKIIITGELPDEEELSYLFVTAIRECVTNSMRYAHATELYIEMSYSKGYAQAVITNNGMPPTEPITEGGGLSSLRHKIERHGGIMEVISMPEFQLKVIVPMVDKEEIL